MTIGSQSAYANKSRIYLAGYMGLNLHNSQDYEESATPARGDVDLDPALSFGGALGFRFNKYFSLEAEANYAVADTDKINIGGTSRSVDGELTAMTFMLNGVYNIDMDWGITPFLTAGAGLGHFDASIKNASPLTQDSSGSDWSLVYQVGGGLRYNVSDALSLSSGYRYLGSSDIGF